MKKVLTLFLAVCMLISIIPMAVSAETIIEPEAPKAPENITTVYVSNAGNNSTEDGTNKNTPYLTFNAAYEAVIEMSGTADRKIVILDDVSAFTDDEKKAMPSTTAGGNATHYLMNQYSAGTIYVCGEDNNNSYPSVDFLCYGKNTSTAYATVILLGADTVFYNMAFDNSQDKTIWLCATLYDLTLEKNISKESTGTFAVGGISFNNTGTGKNSSYNNLDTSKDGCTISIYSGTYGAIFCGNRTGSSNCQYVLTENITLNLYGGTFAGDIDAHASGVTVDANSTVTINAYNITLASGKTIKNSNSTVNANLNLYNANLDGQVTATNFNEVKKCYAVYVGVQNTTVNTNTTDDIPDNTYSVRFVGVVNSLAYDEVGFKITCGERNFDTACKYVYTSIAGDGDDYTAAALGGNYIFAVAIKNIPTEGEVTFTVKPYFVVDNQTYYGTAYTVTYNAEGYVSSAVAN
ncbi:MAG: hypothetical protein IJZ83_00945 [Clostridia bacterium]|nr:hypothetical protein [Clostridia bacterium]